LFQRFTRALKDMSSGGTSISIIINVLWRDRQCCIIKQTIVYVYICNMYVIVTQAWL